MFKHALMIPALLAVLAAPVAVAKEQAKPKLLMTFFTAASCKPCSDIKPVLNFVTKGEQAKVQLLVLDVSSTKTQQQAQQLAQKWGILNHYQAHWQQAGTVLLVNSKTHRVVQTLRNEKRPQVYADAILKHQ